MTSVALNPLHPLQYTRLKHLFAITLVVLSVLSLITYASYPDTSSEVPVLYWVTGANSAREEQLRLFHEWLVKEGHTTDDGKPILELRLDMSNRGKVKQVIQGVSGVGGDISDVFAGVEMRYYQQVGLLEDITEDAKRLGFDTSMTYPVMESEISVNGRQYTFPANVHTTLMWANHDTFARYGQPPPPRRWTNQEFESRGRAFVDAANPPGERRTIFFVNGFNPVVLHRGMGVSRFNETLTRAVTDDPVFIESMEILYRWTHEFHLFPTRSDLASFSVESDFAGPGAHLFYNGNLGMLHAARFGINRLRKFGPMNLSVVEQPYVVFPNAATTTRASSIYAGGKHKDLAMLFLTFLASEDYNMQIVRDGDTLPPNPIYARHEEYLRPPDYPHEWGLNEVFVETIETIAIPYTNSPFVLDALVSPHVVQARESFMNDRLTAREAGVQAAERINAEIARAVDPAQHADPELVALYAERVEQQKQIDALRAAGKKVPLDLISNPFHRKYYQAMGWAEESQEP